MWQRYTELGRQVFLRAIEKAKDDKAIEVTPEHLLYSLLKGGDNVICCILVEMGYSLRRIFAAAVASLPNGHNASIADPPLSVQTKQIAFELAWNEAIRLDNNYIGAEHIFLAILCQEGTPAHLVLSDLGFKLEHMRIIVKLAQSGAPVASAMST